MKIYNFSKVLATPFVIVFGWILYKTFSDSFFDHSIWMIPPFLFLALIYVFQNEINYWWWSRNGFPLDDEVKALLRRHSTFYNALNQDGKNLFEHRMFLWLEGKVYTALGRQKEKVPRDIAAMIAQIPVTMTLARDDFLFHPFDRIFIYKHAFPSPRYQFLHTCETFVEDGVIILSLEHFHAATIDPHRFYHPGWHAFSEAFIKSHPAEAYPEPSEKHWSIVENITGFSKNFIEDTLGFQHVDLLPVLVTIYFLYPQKFSETLPREKDLLDAMFIKGTLRDD